MQKRKIDELISHFNRKVADMDIDMEYKMELLGMITAIGIACEKELLIEPDRKTGKWIDMGDFEQCSVCLGTRLKEVQTFYGKATWLKTDFCPNCGARMEDEE